MNFGTLVLNPGDEVLRRELHSHVGGSTQGGISPSRSYPIVMLFSDPASGARHGYYDGWKSDGYFHYSGEGQTGDQEMVRGNRAIRDHAEQGRDLHLFVGSGKGRPVVYVGRFEYVDHYDTDAPESGTGVIRRVLMFRLRQVDAMSVDAATAPLPGQGERAAAPSTVTLVDDVPIEEQNTDTFYVDPSHETSEAERRETGLVQRFGRWSERSGRRVTRKRIRVAGELKPLFCDVYDTSANLLIEAKGSTTRESMRMAIGQLLDYRRFITPSPRLAVLVPSRPRPDLVELARSCDVAVIVEVEEGEFSEITAAVT